MKEDCPLCTDPITILPGPHGGPETYTIHNHRFYHTHHAPQTANKRVRMPRQI